MLFCLVGTVNASHYELQIFADYLNVSAINGTNDNVVHVISPGRYNITNVNATYEVQRAKIFETLYYDKKILESTNVKSIVSNDPRDYNKNFYYVKTQTASSFGVSETNYCIYNGTFQDTSNNYNISSWAYAEVWQNQNGGTTIFGRYQLPIGTTIVIQDTGDTSSTKINDKVGVDMTAYQKDNSSNTQLYSVSSTGSSHSGNARIETIILTGSEIDWVLEDNTCSSHDLENYFSSMPDITNSEFYITLLTPLDNSQYNTLSLDVNYTVYSENITDCRLYKNGVLSNTMINVYTDTTTVNTFTLSFNSTTEEELNLTIGCNNTEGLNINSTLVTTYIDNVNPIVTTTYTNNSFYIGNQDLVFNFTIQDDFVFSYNLTIPILNFTNYTTELYTTEINEQFSFNLENVTSGRHQIILKGADGHTANEIKGYKNKIVEDELEYSFGDGNIKIKPKQKRVFKSVKTKKHKDRYDFTFTKNKQKDTYSFVVTSTEEIIIALNSEYQGHLIIPGLNKWLDFENEDYIVNKIEQISPYEIELTIYGSSKEEDITFNSIGDLNIVTKTYDFVIGGAVTKTPAHSIETQNVNYYANVTDFNYDSTAVFYYNGTAYNGTLIYYNSEVSTYRVQILNDYINEINITLPTYWNITIDSNELITETENTTIHQMYFGNCTKGNTSLIFNIYDEATLNPMNASLDLIFTYYSYNSALTRTTGSSSSSSQTHTYCIFPDFEEYTVESQGIVYSSTGYNTKQYYLPPTIMNSDVQNISLYMLDENRSTPVYIYVRNGLNIPYIGYTVRVWKYKPSTGQYINIQSAVTDINGEILSFLELATSTSSPEYRFTVHRPSDQTIVYETSKAKVYQNILYLKFDTNVDTLSTFKTVNNITTSLTYTNSTKQFRLTYNAPSETNFDEICFTVNRLKFGSKTNLSFQCSTDLTNILTYTIPDNTTGEYTSYAYVIIDSIEYPLATLSVNINNSFANYGYMGMFLQLMITIAVIMVGLWDVNVAIIFGFLASVLTLAFGISAFALVSVTIYAIIGGFLLFKQTK